MWLYRRWNRACSHSITAIPCHSVPVFFCLALPSHQNMRGCFITGLLVGWIHAEVTISVPGSRRVASDRREDGPRDKGKRHRKSALLLPLKWPKCDRKSNYLCSTWPLNFSDRVNAKLKTKTKMAPRRILKKHECEGFAASHCITLHLGHNLHTPIKEGRQRLKEQPFSPVEQHSYQ